MRASSRSASATLLIGAAALWSGSASAKTSIIFSFPANVPGSTINATDPAGNLYGVTQQGGLVSKCPHTNGCGTVFRLVAPTTSGGAWTQQTLFAFPAGASGYAPRGPARDASGNLYGAALGGKVGGKTGGGVIWKLSPPTVSGGAWSFSVLYTFSPPPAPGRGGPDGALPCGRLVLDGTGTLYGTTHVGGATGAGTVFSLAPPAPGGLAWTQTVLHSFGNGPKGRSVAPNCPLTLSAGGRLLYGTTHLGAGSVFRLRKQPGGWVYQRIGLPGGTGAPLAPNGGLVVDANGNLFGTSTGGGSGGVGTVFELSPPATGQTTWTEQTLHSFAGTDGTQPAQGLAVSGGVTALFGTTPSGGAGGGGVTFRLDPPASGSGPWTYTVLHAFSAAAQGPHLPDSPLLNGHSHRLYGTTFYGGSNGTGTAFSQTPD